MKTFRHCVRVIILKENKVLLCKRYDKNKLQNYEFPGGGIEKKDSFEESVIKECLEEVGIKVKNIKELNLSIVHDIQDLMYIDKEKYAGNINDWVVCEFEKIDKSVYNIERDALPADWVTIDEAIGLIENGPYSVFNKDCLEALCLTKRLLNQNMLLNKW